MVKLIVGEKGKGKTKILLDRANEAAKSLDGNVVYIDKSGKHMFELDRKVRLIDSSRYPLKSGDEFIGFVLGIVSQDHDLQQIYLDGFLKNARVEDDMVQIVDYIEQLNEIGKQFNVEIIVSLSKNKEDVDAKLYDYIDVAL